MSFKSCSFLPLNEVPGAILVPSTKTNDLSPPRPRMLIVDMPIELFDWRDELDGSIIVRLLRKSSILKVPLFFRSVSVNWKTELETSKFGFKDPVTVISSFISCA